MDLQRISSQHPDGISSLSRSCQSTDISKNYPIWINFAYYLKASVTASAFYSSILRPDSHSCSDRFCCLSKLTVDVDNIISTTGYRIYQKGNAELNPAQRRCNINISRSKLRQTVMQKMHIGKTISKRSIANF